MAINIFYCLSLPMRKHTPGGEGLLLGLVNVLAPRPVTVLDTQETPSKYLVSEGMNESVELTLILVHHCLIFQGSPRFPTLQPHPKLPILK